MVTITCDKTGIEFEAASKRQKNHPKVSNLLNWAATKGKPGAYSVALSTFSLCKDEGISDIDAILKRVVETLAEFNEEASEAEWHRIQLKKEQERHRRARYQERHYTNGILSQGGYHWVNLGFKDEEEADAFGLIGLEYEYLQRPDWHLYSSDNREVTVRQAMQEMAERDFRAKNWLEEHK